MFLTGVFTGGDIEGQEARGWWGVRSYRRISSRAHANSFLQARRMKSTSPAPLYLSPRIRGTLSKPPTGRTYHGLIPAHTGNTDAWQLTGFSTWAHPRAYGENNAYALRTGLIQGSSPRIRGKLELRGVPERFKGLIPAHTGNTLSHKSQYPRKAYKYSVSTRIHI